MLTPTGSMHLLRMLVQFSSFFCPIHYGHTEFAKVAKDHDNYWNEKLLSGVIEVLVFTRIEQVFADVSHV